MSQYHLNNIPDDLMEHIRVQAAKGAITMREYLLRIVRKDMQECVDIEDPHFVYPACLKDIQGNKYRVIDLGTEFVLKKETT